jgi:hypothetical protein
MKAQPNGFEILRPPEAVEGRESKVEKGDTAKMCAITCTEFGGKNLRIDSRDNLQETSFYSGRLRNS